MGSCPPGYMMGLHYVDKASPRRRLSLHIVGSPDLALPVRF